MFTVQSPVTICACCFTCYMMNLCLTDCKIRLLFSHESVFLCLEKVNDRGRRERLKEPRERTGDFYQMQWFDAGERPVRMYSCFSYFMRPIIGGGAYSYRVQKNFHPTFNTFKSAKRCCHLSDTVDTPTP